MLLLGLEATQTGLEPMSARRVFLTLARAAQRILFTSLGGNSGVNRSFGKQRGYICIYLPQSQREIALSQSFSVPLGLVRSCQLAYICLALPSHLLQMVLSAR
jgi:hypothetical protein